MLSMALVAILEWDEGGADLTDGLTDIGPIGDGGVLCGRVRALVPGALTTNYLYAT